MNWIKENKQFVGFLSSLLACFIFGVSYVNGEADAGEDLGKDNRKAERFVREEAIDADSVSGRERINARLKRSRDGLQQTFSYQIDPDLTKDVMAVEGSELDPNRLQMALRKVKEELRGGIRVPDNLGFPQKVPKTTEIALALWRLDMVRQLLRQAKKFGVDHVPDKGGIKLPKHNLIDPGNYLEYARVEIRMVGKAESLASVLHQLLRPGKYMTIETAEITYNPLDKSNQVRGSVLPQLKLVVRALRLNEGKTLTKTMPEAQSTQGTSRYGKYKFR